MIQTVLRYGHTLSDVLSGRQPGVPYGGWTVPQLRFWFGRSTKLAERDSLADVAATKMAIDAAVSKEGLAQVKQYEAKVVKKHNA